MFSSYGELSTEVYDLSKPIGHSFGDIEYYRERLKCFHNHLVSGGRIIIDLFLQTNFDTNTVSTRTWITANKEAITFESKLVELSLFEQYVVTCRIGERH